MTPAQLATYVRKKTRTDSTSFPDSIFLIYANNAKNEICEKIQETDEDYFGLRLTRNLEAGIRNYSLDSGILNGIKKAEGKIDGTNQKPLDVYNLNKMNIATDESSIVSYMAGRPWGYFIFGSEIWVMSEETIIDVEDGLVMWANVYPKDLTDLTSTDDMSEAPSDTEFGIPRIMHELLARRIIIEYKTSQEKPIPLTEREQKFDEDLKDKIKLLTGFNVDESIVPEAAYNDGSDY